MKEPLLVVLLLLVGCSGTSTGTDAPTTCKRGDRVGTYRFSYVEQSGTCGAIDSQLVSLNPETGGGGGGSGPACTVNSERWTEGDCKLERDVTCTTSSGSVRTVGVTRVQTADASVITGTASFSITGAGACTGTYAVDAQRQ